MGGLEGIPGTYVGLVMQNSTERKKWKSRHGVKKID